MRIIENKANNVEEGGITDLKKIQEYLRNLKLFEFLIGMGVYTYWMMVKHTCYTNYLR